MLRHFNSRLFFVAFLTVLLPGSGALPGDDPTPLLTPAGQQAYERLLTTSLFAGPYLGFGIRPRSITALQILLREPAADRALKALLQQATLEGQLYALTGLYFTDPAYFYPVAAWYLLRTDEVSTEVGCIIGRSAVAAVTLRILAGDYPQSFTEPDDSE